LAAHPLSSPSEIGKAVPLLAPNRHVCLRLLLALGIALAVFGCRHAGSPDAAFQQIRDEMRRGHLDAASRDVETASGKYRTNPEWAARFRVLKAHVLFLRGAYNEALALLSPELPDSLARSDVAVHRKMVQGLAYTYLQQYVQADTSLVEAEKLGVSINSSFLGDVAQARGILEIDQKRYAQANAAFRNALSIARRRNLPFLGILALGNLGNVAMWQEHYDEAIDRFKAVLEQAKSLGSLSSESRALGNMGWNYSVVGDFENAETFLAEAQSKSAQVGLVVDQIRWLNSLAGVYAQEGRYPEADSTGQKALALAKNQDDKRLRTECLNTMSEIMLATRRFDDAEKFNREAADVENAGLDQFGIASSTIIAGRIAASKKQYRNAEKAFQKVIQNQDVQTPLRWEAQAGVAEVNAAKGETGVAEREFLASIGTITKARDAVEHEEFRLSFLSSAIRFYDAYVNFLIAQKRPLDALKIADRSRAQTLEHGLSSAANGKSAQSTASRPQEIAQRLNATLLFYWLGEQRSFLWAITPAKVSLFSLPPKAEIDSAVKSYLASFTDPRDPLEAGNVDGKKLYTTLIQPAERLIRKNSRVIVLPDGNLNSLNFETLIVPSPKPHYWIEDATLLTAGSLSLLSKASVSTPPKNTNLLLMGDAVSASPDFPPLPQAGKEVELVETYFPEGRRSVLTGSQATASHFLSGKPEEFSYLHFATHGTASTARPLESAVILSPEGDSYKLYARDIVQHPLHAYLVTISACNGAGMRTYAGEGLVGLAWAFLRAGAHNVIAGLWEVSNASTPQLMDELYKGLNVGKDPATALRAAKLMLVHSGGNYRKPFYWAPFQLYAGS
jgi:CHAT domain-containing protein/lipopolysaccharide biosynthesis regulator YciM